MEGSAEQEEVVVGLEGFLDDIISSSFRSDRKPPHNRLRSRPHVQSDEQRAVQGQIQSHPC